MKFVIGLACIGFGAWQVKSALDRRRKVATGAAVVRQPETEASEAGAKLAVMGEILTPLLVGGVAVLGLMVTLLFFTTGGGGYVSFFDLLGFLFLLGAYGFWVSTMTRFREVPDEEPEAAVSAPARDAARSVGDER